MSNQITAYFKGRTGVAEPVYQNDYGMVLNFDGIYLPSNFDCHFSVLGSDTAIPGVGADNRVAIPNTVLSHEGNVTVHIPLHTGSDDSEVEYVVYFKVIGRARPEDDGTPVQMTAIEKALALLSQPITNIEEIVNEALSFTGETFDEMRSDLQGDYDTFAAGVSDDISDMQEDIAGFKTEIRGDISDVEADFTVLQGQFDTAVAGVTTDTEVTDIRVGADGVTDTTAGASVRRQFTNLKSALNRVTGNGIIEKTSGYYINVTASQASIDAPIANVNYSYSLIECTEGDKFTVSAEVSSAVRAWAFIKSDKSTLIASSGGANANSIVLTAPKDTAYLVINDNGGNISYVGEVIRNSLSTLIDDSQKLQEANYFHDWIIGAGLDTSKTTLDYKPMISAPFNYAVVDCDASQEFVITGTGGSSSRLWAFYDANETRLSVASPSVTEFEKVLIVPHNAVKLVVNVNTSQPYNLLIRQKAEDDDNFEDYALTKSFSIADFTANITYDNVTVGSYLSSLDTISSGTGNYCLPPIKVKESQRVFLQADKYSRSDQCAIVVDESLLVVMAYNKCENGIQFTIPVDGYLLVSTLPSRFHGLTVYGLTETQVDSGSFKDIYCPYPQLPANSDSSSDFDAEDLTSDDLFAYLDNLSQKHPFILSSENMGKDASNTFDVKRYIVMPRSSVAWLDASTPFRYKWTNSSTNYYTESWFPRVGDTVYSSATGSSTVGNVTSVNSENQTIVINGNTCSRSGTNRSDQNVVYSSSLSTGAALTTETGTSVGSIASVNGNTITSSTGTTYIRFPMYDKNQFGNSGTIYIGANEHGPTSDPRDCAIVVTRLIKDIVEGRNDDYISYLRSNFRLVIMPICNPWGFNQQTAGRLNYNGVNLNRNYPTSGWNVISDTDKGSAPASEIEMQYMINTVAQSDANVGIDIHCLGYVTQSNDGKLEYMGFKQYFAINRVALCLKANYNLLLGNYGSVDPATTATGASFFRMLGIDGGLLEFQARQGKTGDTDTSLHTAQTMSANYTFLLQMLNMYLSDHNRMLDIKYAD